MVARHKRICVLRLLRIRGRGEAALPPRIQLPRKHCRVHALDGFAELEQLRQYERVAVEHLYQQGELPLPAYNGYGVSCKRRGFAFHTVEEGYHGVVLRHAYDGRRWCTCR